MLPGIYPGPFIAKKIQAPMVIKNSITLKPIFFGGLVWNLPGQLGGASFAIMLSNNFYLKTGEFI